MKRYKEYMDLVEPSAGLHERLVNLHPAKKHPARVKYAAFAAALVVVLGAGGFALTRGGGNTELGKETAEGAYYAAVGEIAIEPGGMPGPVEGQTQTVGGYEVPSPDGVVVSYYMLPFLRYGEVSSDSAASMAVPVGVESREMTEKEILNLLGGEAALVTHLGWGGYEVSGHVMAYTDGTVWRAYLFGKGEDGYFALTMAPDVVPFDCCVAVEEDGEVNVTDVWGVAVTGGYGGIYGEGENREVWFPESREVSFAAKGVGCRFTFYGAEGEVGFVEEKVARFVRLAIVDGLELDALTPGWEPEMVEYSVMDGVAASQGPELQTPPYDPNGNG